MADRKRKLSSDSFEAPMEIDEEVGLDEQPTVEPMAGTSGESAQSENNDQNTQTHHHIYYYHRCSCNMINIRRMWSEAGYPVSENEDSDEDYYSSEGECYSPNPSDSESDSGVDESPPVPDPQDEECW